MNIEVDLLKEYNAFMKKNSVFAEKLQILPDTPQSFSKFPTIIFKEQDNTDNLSLLTLNRLEFGDNLTYQVDIYTKNITINGTEYNSRVIINELKDLTAKFFKYCDFQREGSTRGEYTDINVKRQTMLFSGSLSSWNKNIF
jgi:hypothetical protein